MRDLILALLSKKGATCLECIKIDLDVSYTSASMWQENEEVWEYRILHTDTEIMPVELISKDRKLLFGKVRDDLKETYERGLTEKLGDCLYGRYETMDIWKEEKKEHITKEALQGLIKSMMERWQKDVLSEQETGAFKIAYSGYIGTTLHITFTYKGRVQEPLKFRLFERTAVKARNFGNATGDFKTFVEKICPVVWYGN